MQSGCGRGGCDERGAFIGVGLDSGRGKRVARHQESSHAFYE